MNFLAIHRDLRRRGDAEANVVSFHGDDGQADVPVDDDLFSGASCQNQHDIVLLGYQPVGIPELKKNTAPLSISQTGF
jgi:hypothetical protein